jgi:hypothetical protein
MASLSVSPTPRAMETTMQRKQGKDSQLVLHREQEGRPYVSPAPGDNETTL